MQFATRRYEHVVYVNFVESPYYKGINEEGYAVEDIVRLLSRMNPEFRFEAERTLIFFDEVQEFPEITTALKFFHIDGRFDVICSGSLLGVQYSRIESHSVGYKLDYEMRSFDFEEYLWARGYQDDVVEDMLGHLLRAEPFSNAELERYFSLFLDYVILGGMPAVISAFVQSGTFEETAIIQQQLLRDYREDIRKYASGVDKAKILAVFNQVAPQLAKENKKFQLTKVAKHARSRDYLGCVEWLLDSGLLSICYCLQYPELPLKGNFDPSKYKLYVAVGDVMENCEAHRELLGLPEYVFPAAMLVFGFPTQQQLDRPKPQRCALSHVVHENAYRRLSGDELRTMFQHRVGDMGFVAVP